MTTSRTNLIPVSLALLVAFGVARVGLGQSTPPEISPANPPARVVSEPNTPPTRESARPDRTGERAARPAVMQFLRKRLSEAKAREAALDEAIKRLEAGEDPLRIRDEFEPRRNAWREAGAAPRDGLEPDGEPESFRPNPDRPRAGKPGVGKLGPDKPGPLTAEERDRALHFLTEHLPRVGARLTELSKTSPEMVERLLGRMRPRLAELRSIQHDQDLFELKVRELEGGMRIMDARRAYHEAKASGSPDSQSKETELRSALSQQFDTQLAIQKQEVDRLSKRVETLRNEVEKRQSDRDAAIDRQMIDAASDRGPGGFGPPKRPENR